MPSTGSAGLSPLPLHRGGGDIDIVAEEVVLSLRRGETGKVKAFFALQEAVDITGLLERMDPPDALTALDQLPLRDRAEVFGELRPAAQRRLGAAMPPADLAALMAEMSHDERADLFNRLDTTIRETVLPIMARAERDDLRRLSSHAEGTVGAIMTSDYATLRREMTVDEALASLRAQAIDSETVYTAFVVDAGQRLLGKARLREILLARSGDRIGDIMQHDPVSVSVTADPEVCAGLVARYDIIALPVIDSEHRLVGIVTHDDAMDVAREEATEDIHRSSTVGDFEGSVRDAPFLALYRARIVWLVLLVFGNIFSGVGISVFEDTIAGNLALLFFLPLLIGSGGNAGAQSATLMVRAIATGDLRASDWGAMLARELVIGLALGLTMALAVSGIGLARAGVDVTVVVMLSMVLIVLMGALIGVSLPFVLTRFNLDPATASGPLVTSIADVAGVLIYFGIARAMLPV